MTSDRYNVNPGDPGAQLEQRLRNIEERLDALFNRTLRHSVLPEGSVTILNAAGDPASVVTGTGFTFYDATGNVVSVFDGTGFRMYDDTGTLRAEVGHISASAGYGVSIYDAAGGLRFEVNDDGYRDPWLPHPMIEAGIGTTITSGTFIPVYQGQAQLITHQGLSVTVVVNADVGTTAEFRVKNTDGGATTSAVSVGSGASVSQTFNWLHGSDLGGGPVRFDVEARRVSGAGNVYVFQPYTLAMADPVQCSATGL